jgi:hypothetical protein
MARLRNTSTISSTPKICRAALVLAAVILLGGCNSLGNGDVSSLYAIARSQWNGNDQKVTLEEAASVPYASMGIRLGDGPQNMVILAGDAGGQRLWTSSAKVAITTKDGRIVRTAGLGHDLGGYESRGDSLGENGTHIVRWQADFPDLNLYSVSITCRDRQTGNETIVILGKDIDTRRIGESCTTLDSRLDWSFENTYWVDPTGGLVWRSVQHVNPKLDAIETEILRPPA